MPIYLVLKSKDKNTECSFVGIIDKPNIYEAHEFVKVFSATNGKHHAEIASDVNINWLKRDSCVRKDKTNTLPTEFKLSDCKKL